ncbi:MAG: hypothetical protein PHC95_06830 [Parabacteroides sp.]|nr:hypothetical protein [Parabacteroides sp.]
MKKSNCKYQGILWSCLRVFYCCCCFLVLQACLRMEFQEQKENHLKDEEDDKKQNGETILPDLSVPDKLDWQMIHIAIPLSAIKDPDLVRVRIPVLKYDKKLAYSYTFDDCVVAAYGKAFCMINRKWVDKEKFYHVGQQRSTGFMPPKSLGYTDGCGNERRFTFGVAIWPDMENRNIDSFMNPVGREIGKYYPYLVWRDIVPLLDFGCDIYFHNVNEIKYGNEDVNNLLKGLVACQDTTVKKLGRGMKVLVRSDGNDLYVDAGRKYEDVVFMCASASPDPDIPFAINLRDDKFDLYKKCQSRRYTELTPNAEELMAGIEEVHGTSYSWLHDFSHAPNDFQYILDLFVRINDTYGKDGDDSIWFASLDEIFEYVNFRKNCEITKVVSNDSLYVRFECDLSDVPDKFQYHRDFSVLLSGVDSKNIKIGSGSGVYGLSYAEMENKDLLININCNSSLLEKAERYTKLFENDHLGEKKEDALYFINQLKEEYRIPFLMRCK